MFGSRVGNGEIKFERKKIKRLAKPNRASELLSWQLSKEEEEQQQSKS